MARQKAEDRATINDPEELMALAKKAARRRDDQFGYREDRATWETTEQINSLIKEAYDEPWKGGEYLRMRFATAGQDLKISVDEYRLATRGSGLYDSTITSSLKRFVTPGKRISRRFADGFYHIKIVDDLSREAAAKSHEDSIRKEERERIKGLVAALAVDFAGNALTGIYKATLFAAIDLGLTASDISQEASHEE